MNEPLPDDTHGLKAAWLGWAWVLPQIVLTLLNGQAWRLARGDMNHDQLVHAMRIGLYEAALLAFGIIAWVVLISRRKPIGIRLALAAIAVHTGYLWYVFQGIGHLLPSTVSIWMLPETEVVFYQFSLMMPVVFLMMVRLARIRLKISASLDVGLSLAFLVIVPSGFFILGSMIARIGRLVSWQNGMQYLLITAIVTATAFVLVVFLRLMIRLQDLIQRRSWSEWAIPLAAGLLAPLSGLALNASIPFPYDFQDGSIYAMTILNAAALLIPFRPGTRWALPGWAARAVFYPFTLFFFLVFLPFLPLSLLAMIAAGAGFLILAPLFLFTVHTRRLWEQGCLLARQRGTARVVTRFTICVLILPVTFMIRNELDRRTLNRAVDAVFSPDYQATQLPLRRESLRRALDRMDDIKHGIYLPYLSDIYNTMVFHGMVLPDEKADLIRQSLLGTEPNTSARSGIWGNGFLGMRSRSQRRGRGDGVTRHVAMASQEVECRQTNEIVESEIRVVLENQGGANGEFSERITVPAGVLTTGFWLDVNGTNKFAQLRERKTATWVYEMIRDMTRRDPGLLVYEDDQHLRLRVYPFAQGEKRRCGLRFRFPAALQPVIRIGDTPIALITPSDRPLLPAATSATMTEGGAALAIPAAVITNWPTFQREVVAHLILDRSARAETNRVAVTEQARLALRMLPPSISQVRLTWANYEQEDTAASALTRDEALRALDQAPALPGRGGFCPERVITRVLLASEQAPRTPEPAGQAFLFVVIPAPGSIPVHAMNLAPLIRLSPDLPGYLILRSNQWEQVAFGNAMWSPVAQNFRPLNVVTLRYGSDISLMATDRDALLFAPGAGTWQIWNPGTARFDILNGTVACDDPAWRAGLSLWARHGALAWTPAQVDAALPDLVNGSRSAQVLIPETAFIVVETKSQEEIIHRKERQSLDANHTLEFDNAKQAPAPRSIWLVVPALLILWQLRKRNLRQVA